MEYELLCPRCNHGDELRLIENARVERQLGSVTTLITEYRDLVQQDFALDPAGFNACVIDFFEIGVSCDRCGFTHIGDDWKKVLVNGEALPEME
jgi:hypothetical protein